MRFTSRSTGIFVWMTDKFMSGWGQARGKINKLIIRCDTLEQAECIFKNAQMRDEMKNVNYGRKLPYFSENKYKLSFKTWDQLGYVWKTGCKWQNEDDYNDDPGRMRYTMEGLRGNPPQEILSQKKELVRIASQVAQNLVNHFGPGMGGYENVANSERLPASVRRVMNGMSYQSDNPDFQKFSMYFPRSYNVEEWQKGGNLDNHLWWGQTDKGRLEVIRKGIELMKKGSVDEATRVYDRLQLRRRVRRNQMRSSFDKPVFGPGKAEYKRIDTTTGAGMRLEQKMRRAGWYQAQVTPFSTVLYRKKRR